MRGIPPILLKHPANAKIVRFLQERSPSAHGDVTSEMVLAAEGLRNVHSFAPQPASYSYEALHTSEGVIFCVAVGQSTLLCRIPSERRRGPAAQYGKPFPPLGPEWVAIPAFQPEIPLAAWRKTLKSLMKAAFDAVL